MTWDDIKIADLVSINGCIYKVTKKTLTAVTIYDYKTKNNFDLFKDEIFYGKTFKHWARLGNLNEDKALRLLYC